MKKGSKKGLVGSTLILAVLFAYMLFTGQISAPGPEGSSSINSAAMQQAADGGQSAAGADVIYTFRTQEQFEDHFEKHGSEMGYETPEAYLIGANRVIASDDALHKLEEEDGDDVYYLESTNEFVILSEDDYIRTYFLPDDGIEYYYRQ